VIFPKGVGTSNIVFLFNLIGNHYYIFLQRKEATRRRKPEEHYLGKKIKDRKVLILPF
jgi:hypothetical protein